MESIHTNDGASSKSHNMRNNAGIEYWLMVEIRKLQQSFLPGIHYLQDHRSFVKSYFSPYQVIESVKASIH